jgi:mannitol/fructose-specific phosphotransferase system IIA component (Ntr-type)
MRSSDFTRLSGLVSAYGLEGLNLIIGKMTASNGEEIGSRGQNHGVLGPFLWPFLTEKLIFDLTGVEEKSTFLEYAVERLAEQVEGLDAGKILGDLLQREKAASTGIGHGIAVPHAYSTGLEGMIVALFRVPEGLDFGSIDEKPVRLVFILAGPRSDELLHLKLLARIARLFSHNSIYERILKAPAHKEVLSIFRSAEMCLPY